MGLTYQITCCHMVAYLDGGNRDLLNVGIIVLMLQYFVANSDPSIKVSIFHCYRLHFQGAFMSGYGISSHGTVYFSLVGLKFFHTFHLVDTIKTGFDILRLCVELLVRPMFIDSADFFRKMQ